MNTHGEPPPRGGKKGRTIVKVGSSRHTALTMQCIVTKMTPALAMPSLALRAGQMITK